MELLYPQLLKEAKMQELKGDLDTHFCQKVLTCASRFQSASPTENQAEPILSVDSMEIFGKELLHCLQGQTPAEVTTWQTQDWHYECLSTSQAM